MCFSRYCLICPDKALDGFVNLRRRLPARIDFPDSSQCFLHPAGAHRQPCFLCGRDGLPSAENTNLSAATRSPAADEDRPGFRAFAGPLSAVGIARGDARLLRAEAGLQSKAQRQGAKLEGYRRRSIARL
ncbi:hypothetical protein AX760_03895 [Pararhizobium antarcticum]|uniref:Uncharacterized protein n=1 Tax=Pararhizobium antarcticum TaxID=1798805 RepID=A0A657LRL3_9HYPH|nr:hypothetical protein AX760_03895 [Pararhizobium antarcticum]OJF97484.1 hypothetical protein AX761_14795 [Rhizobium sp. 58]